jgi:cytochrome c oxidase subunit 1
VFVKEVMDTSLLLPEESPRVNYLNAAYGIKSWLLTRDHKRIALLYLASISVFFFLGGIYAMMIRLELLTPQGDLVQSDTYNKLFTQHGIIMVFFFLIPSIPAVLGNFLIPRRCIHAMGVAKRRSGYGLDILCSL